MQRHISLLDICLPTRQHTCKLILADIESLGSAAISPSPMLRLLILACMHLKAPAAAGTNCRDVAAATDAGQKPSVLDRRWRDCLKQHTWVTGAKSLLPI